MPERVGGSQQAQVVQGKINPLQHQITKGKAVNLPQDPNAGNDLHKYLRLFALNSDNYFLNPIYIKKIENIYKLYNKNYNFIILYCYNFVILLIKMIFYLKRILVLSINKLNKD